MGVLDSAYSAIGIIKAVNPAKKHDILFLKKNVNKNENKVFLKLGKN